MQKNAIFKMEIQTSVIQVDRADRRCHIVADALLCVEKARCILKNPHTRRRQLCIIGARYPIDELFVRDARRNNPHIHTALRCQAQLPAHLIADNQIRRCEINIFGSRLYNAHVHIFSHRFAVQRAVCIRLNEAGSAVRCNIRIRLRSTNVPIRHAARQTRLMRLRTILQKIRCIVCIRTFNRIPHFQKHHSQAAHCIPFQPDAGILPVTIWMRDVKIFVRQIISARKTDFPIDYGNLSMIAVVHKNV